MILIIYLYYNIIIIENLLRGFLVVHLESHRTYIFRVFRARSIIYFILIRDYDQIFGIVNA